MKELRCAELAGISAEEEDERRALMVDMADINLLLASLPFPSASGVFCWSSFM